MKLQLQRFILPLLLLAFPACVRASDPAIERTKTTTATYAAYAWGVSRSATGESDDGWSAEIHSGDWHRMEASHTRVIANCRTHVGGVYDVASGKISDSPNAWLGACGIYSLPDIRSVELIDSIASLWGKLDLLKVSDPRFTRFYAISAEGIIVRSNWISADRAPLPCIQLEPIAILSSVPTGEIFTRSSLTASVVADQYKVGPSREDVVGLSGKRCGH